MPDDDLELDEEPAKKSNIKLIIILVVAAVILIAGTGIVTYLLLADDAPNTAVKNEKNDSENNDSNDDEASEVKKEAIYLPLEPAFVVNFQGKSSARYLQIKVEVLTRDETIVDKLKRHDPMIRNNLLLLFSAQSAKELRSIEGKEALRQAVTTEINKVLVQESGDEKTIESVFFTSFVMQ